MKIVASGSAKNKIILSFVLFLILGSLGFGTVIVSEKLAVDAASNKVNQTVIIDAGHGGPDGGTSADDGTLEKDLNLQIAIKLNESLNSMGIKTVMIRTEDISVHDASANTIRQKKVSDLKNRLKIINETENSIFVSIHQNHFSDSRYSGTQVFYSKNNPQSSVLADCIRQSVISDLQKENTRETKQSGTDIYLLYHAESPAVMVECGFLSNINESKNLKNENYQKELAFVLALGISDYLNSLKEL